MYKRRIRTSTLSSASSSQASTTSIATNGSRVRSPSPKDMFTEGFNAEVPAPAGSPSPKKQKTLSLAKSPVKHTTKDLLDMLTSSPESNRGSLQRVRRGKLSSPARARKKPETFLEEVLELAGMKLSKDDSPNVLRVDQSIFIRDIGRELTCRQRETETRLEKFMDEMLEYFSDFDKLKIALSPSKTDPDCNITLGDSQDSLVRLLLNVEVLQVKLIELLSEKICELVYEKDNPKEDLIGWIRLMLQPMRYLNFVSEPGVITKTLFEIINFTSNVMVAQEIINCLPDIITDEQYGEVTDNFVTLMKDQPALTLPILISLENLCCDSEILYQVQISLIKSLRKAPLEHILAYVRLIITGSCPSHIDELINGLRSELIICMPSSCLTQGKYNLNDLSTTQTLIFDKLRDSVLKSKKLAEAWLKNISKVKTASKHKPIDIIMLLILHNTALDLVRRRAVETVFRSKIKANEFNEDLIKDTFSALPIVIKQYFEVFLKVCSILLQSSDIVVSKYAASIYEECFSQFDNQWCKMMLLNLLDQIRMRSNNTKAALSVVHSLTLNYCSKISPHITHIFLLLDSVFCTSEFSVTEVRLLMDTICMIAFGETEDDVMDMSSFQDEIHMIVQKQLSCPDINVFRCGIVCSLMAIKHMASVPENAPNDTPVDCDEENIALSEKSKKAYKLLEMILVGTKSSGEAQVLAYDQLSHVVMSCENLDKSFIKKVSLLMQNSLQNYYIIASSDFQKKNDDLDASLQFCIDYEIEDPIALHLTEAVMRDESSGNQCLVGNHVPCIALPSLLRVIRSLELADLTEIDALLGCALTMPNISLITSFGMQDTYLQKLLLDSLFHACNWFREILNSFIYFIKEGKPEKIIMRLRAIAYLQSLISNCLPQAISYSPPKYFFSSSSPIKAGNIAEKQKKTTARGRKGKKKVDKEKPEGEEPVEETVVDSEEEKEEEEIESVEFAVFKSHLRELDFDVCLVLTQPLTMSPKPFKDGEFSPDFGPNELMLIMDDLHSKLKFILGSKKTFPGKTKQEVGFDNLSTVRLELIIRNFSKLAQHLTGHLQKLVEFSHNLIKTHDEIWDAPGMFAPGTAEIKQCIALILNCFNIYFSWSGIRSESNCKFFMKAVSYLSGVGKGKPSTLNEVLIPCLSYLREISKCITDLPSAVSLVSLLNTLKSQLEESDEILEVNVEGICENFLRRRWYDFKGGELKGPGVNQSVSTLLDIYLSESVDCLKRISNTLNWLSEEASSLGNDTTLTTFPHINKTNLNILIKCLCKGLTNVCKNGVEIRDCKEQLKIWDSVMSNLQLLVAVLKAQDSKVNLRHFLKGCLPILKLFLSQGMNVCSVMFKMESLVVPQLLKKLQVVTRYIQTVCNYSKVSKDTLIIQQLPIVRGLLENILLSVKSMVVKNKCTDAFFMGSMKNKDLKGEVIESQEDEEETDERSTEEFVPVETTAGEENQSAGSGEESDDHSGGAISDTC